jgi:hypothetical protein
MSIAFVQGNSNTGHAVASVSVPFTNPNTAGNTIIATDALGNTASYTITATLPSLPVNPGVCACILLGVA